MSEELLLSIIAFLSAVLLLGGGILIMLLKRYMELDSSYNISQMLKYKKEFNDKENERKKKFGY